MFYADAQAVHQQCRRSVHLCRLMVQPFYFFMQEGCFFYVQQERDAIVSEDMIPVAVIWLFHFGTNTFVRQ